MFKRKGALAGLFVFVAMCASGFFVGISSGVNFGTPEAGSIATVTLIAAWIFSSFVVAVVE